MKTFDHIKRELRTLYRPKGLTKTRAKATGISKGATEQLNEGSDIQLRHMSSLPDAKEVEEREDTSSYKAPGSTQIISQSPLEEDESLTQEMDIEPGVRTTSFETSNRQATDEAGPEDEVSRELPSNTNTDSYQQQVDLEAAQNVQPLSWEEAQAIREGEYMVFYYEEPSDYTEGPARMIYTADGVKQDCVALLMTLELSAKIQKAILRQRDFARAKTAGMIERRSLLRLDSKIGREISSCMTRLAILEKAGKAESEAYQKLEQQKSNLELMRKDIHDRRERIRNNIEVDRAEKLLAIQADVNAHLEEAFIAARLLAPAEEEPEPPFEELDVAQEYQAFCEQLAAMNEEPFEYSVFDHNSDHMKAEPLSEEQQARQAVINDFWRVKDALDLAHREFDNREAQRDREYQENITAADNGGATTDESPEAFDVRWVMQNRNLTRNLIDAEAAYAAKKREVLEAGIPLPFTDAGTAFEDTMDVMVEGVGSDVPEEQETVVPNSPPGVRRWLSKLPEDAEAEVAGDEANGDADEWDAEEVGISDSVSVVAEGKERARIDRWRQACAEARED